jgi:hypothetical protein
MKETQETFSLKSDFSKVKMKGEAAMLPLYIDLAIYDLMADQRKRSVNEVVSTLTVLGYMRSDINRRMVVMLHKRNMFVQAGGGKGKVLYELKKGAKRPDFMGGEAKTVDTVKESEIILRPSHDSVPVTFRKRRTFNISEMTMQNQTTQPQDSPLQLLCKAFNPDNQEDPTSPHPVEAAADTISHVVQPNDPIRVALWKVMADHQPYKYTDLCTLLSHIPTGTITYHLRKMVDLNMLNVDRTDKKCHIYQLIEGVPMPEGLPPYEPNVPLPAAQPQLPLNQEPEMQTKTDYTIKPQPQPEAAADASVDEPFVMPPDAELDAALDAAGPVGQFTNPNEPAQPSTNLPDLVKAASETKAQEAPLVEIGGIMIKGQHFTYKAARELLAELKDAGYGHEIGVIDRKVGKYVTTTWSVTIGMVEVTPHQANDIALSLIEELE